MIGISTLTERGQVVIPQKIRKLLGLEPADKLIFEVEGDKIIAKPIPSIDDVFGMISAKGKVSKKDYKKEISKQINKKFQNK
jgi:AbrB family looped-hinge helix DNA binding protein